MKPSEPTETAREALRRLHELHLTESESEAVVELIFGTKLGTRPATVAVSGRDLKSGLGRSVIVRVDDLFPPDAGVPAVRV